MKKKIKITFLFVLSIGVLIASPDIFENVNAAIRSGDARQVSRYFSKNVDLTILSQEEVYSKAQAELILKDFFAKNAPKSFSFIHQGLSKEGSKYAIGSLVTTQAAKFRVYIYIKQAAGAEFIQEIRFEKE
jgi:hypothetical protein